MEIDSMVFIMPQLAALKQELNDELDRLDDTRARIKALRNKVSTIHSFLEHSYGNQCHHDQED